jgi:hypothetical protein
VNFVLFGSIKLFIIDPGRGLHSNVLNWELVVSSQLVDLWVFVSEIVELLTHLSPEPRSVCFQLFSNVCTVIGWICHNFGEDSAALWVVSPSPHHKWIDEQESWPHIAIF